MRKSLLVGVVLVVTAVVVVALSGTFDLELESVALTGVAAGAVLALVPDRSPLMRLAGFAAGFVAAWVGYLVRAGLLPDTTSGRAVDVGIIVVLCVAVALLSVGRVPLWATLLGAGAMSGAYEHIYSAAPTEVVSTSFSAATSLLLTAATGFLVVALLASRPEDPADSPAVTRPRADDGEHHALDEMLETAK